ncbi:MAG: hypothetical protein A2521_06660 [Deltaproteobacteria bacterium RIFOXYD12_FULL_57_12]|nr:MAG: hypothetical protein A2521_06660 [Deltaproteobacteria bacterium RIFOXYD12_FULL_57_12]
MHNSQNNAALVHAGTGAKWTAGSLTGGSSTDPQSYLLTTDCVGCHSNSAADTIITVSGARIPIVFNSVVPTNPLAGGNFYWVATAGGNDTTKGHNVRGISAADSNLAGPPGPPGAGCEPCHTTLTAAPVKPGGFAFVMNGGCEACHVARHHAPGSGSVVVGKDDGWFRFLGSTMEMAATNSNKTNAGVTGIEDPDWEQTSAANKHNVYKGTVNVYMSGGMGSGLADSAVGQVCVGCHQTFHRYMTDAGQYLITGSWIRHPADVVMPDADDFRGTPPTSTPAYNPIAPVAKQAIVAGDQNTPTVALGSDVVMCLSCHRPHGSPYPDMLRWDYRNDCKAWEGDGLHPNCGCLVCHTAKDDIL